MKLNKILKHFYFLNIFIIFFIFCFICSIRYETDWFGLNIFDLNNKNPEKEFTLNPNDSICNPSTNKKILLIIMVAIAPVFFEKRNLIRNNWANKQFSNDVKIIFLLAKSQNETINKMIDDEFEIYKDIVQKNYIDSYYNLTLKIMMGLNWISKYCPNSKYILRINDDVIVNTYNLIKYLKGLKYEKNQIFGYGISGVSPIRDKGSKFYVSENEYPKPYYEPYIEGSAYLFTTDLASIYYFKYLNYSFPPFSVWLEDVYIGMLAKIYGTRIVNIANYFTPHTQYNSYTKEEKRKILLDKGVRNVLFIYDLNEVSYFWSIISDEMKKKRNIFLIRQN